VSTHAVKLVKREEIAEGTMAFHFDRPSGFAFKAGQAIDLTLVEPAGGPAQNERHAFSIVNAPFEDGIVVATRMRDSAYKRALRTLPVGALAQMRGPFGKLTLHTDRTRPAVLVAGGIGITPFVSIVRQARRDDWPHEISLLYANRSPEAAAFLGELQQLARDHCRFRILATMTASEGSAAGWKGETRPIGETLLRAASEGLALPIYYLVGPPGMVESASETLSRAGVPEADVRSEIFYGY
jgi:ferredoxin-NADP reductase